MSKNVRSIKGLNGDTNIISGGGGIETDNDEYGNIIIKNNNPFHGFADFHGNYLDADKVNGYIYLDYNRLMDVVIDAPNETISFRCNIDYDQINNNIDAMGTTDRLYTDSSINTLQEKINDKLGAYYNQDQVDTQLGLKQNRITNALNAGNNIFIDESGKINANFNDVGADWGDIVGNITDQYDLINLINTSLSPLEQRIADKQDWLKAGNNIQIAEDGITISATSAPVSSVNSHTGAVVLKTSDLNLDDGTPLNTILDGIQSEVGQFAYELGQKQDELGVINQGDNIVISHVGGVAKISATVPSGTTVWGDILGDMNNQTDLNTKFSVVEDEIAGLTLDTILLRSNTIGAQNIEGQNGANTIRSYFNFAGFRSERTDNTEMAQLGISDNQNITGLYLYNSQDANNVYRFHMTPKVVDMSDNVRQLWLNQLFTGSGTINLKDSNLLFDNDSGSDTLINNTGFRITAEDGQAQLWINLTAGISFNNDRTGNYLTISDTMVSMDDNLKGVWRQVLDIPNNQWSAWTSFKAGGTIANAQYRIKNKSQVQIYISGINGTLAQNYGAYVNNNGGLTDGTQLVLPTAVIPAANLVVPANVGWGSSGSAYQIHVYSDGKVAAFNTGTGAIVNGAVLFNYFI